MSKRGESNSGKDGFGRLACSIGVLIVILATGAECATSPS
jgi:hypothetical protein